MLCCGLYINKTLSVNISLILLSYHLIYLSVCPVLITCTDSLTCAVLFRQTCHCVSLYHNILMNNPWLMKNSTHTKWAMKSELWSIWCFVSKPRSRFREKLSKWHSNFQSAPHTEAPLNLLYSDIFQMEQSITRAFFLCYIDLFGHVVIIKIKMWK